MMCQRLASSWPTLLLAAKPTELWLKAKRDGRNQMHANELSGLAVLLTHFR